MLHGHLACTSEDMDHPALFFVILVPFYESKALIRHYLRGADETPGFTVGSILLAPPLWAMLIHMKYRILTVLLLMTLGVSAEVYRSVDEDGNVVFSDKPGPGAEAIELDEVQTIKVPPPPRMDFSPKKKPSQRYTEVAIQSPQNDEAIRNDGGDVTVNISVKPGLNANDSVVLYLDGREIDLGGGLSKAFSGLDRGTHTLRAVVKDANGKELKSSSTSTFHLLRNSVLNRKRGS